MPAQTKQLKGTPHSAEISKLKRIEGQVRGILKMVEDERYCIDILTQIKAVKAALSTVERNIIDDHLNHCVQSALQSKDKTRANEVMQEIKDLLKTLK